MKTAINEATTMQTGLMDDLAAYQEAGFEGVELWWDKVKDFLKKNSSSDLCDLLKKFRLKPVSICPFLFSPFRNREQCRAAFLEALAVAKEIECKLLVICPDFQPIKLRRKQAMELHAEELYWYGIHAKKMGLELAIEPIGLHTLVPGPFEALALIEAAGSLDNVGILVDTFHYTKSGITPEEVMQIPLEKLKMVHVNDSEDGTLNELSDADRVYPTLGCMDLKGYMHALRAIKYEGYLSVEIFREEYWKQNADIVAKNSYKYLEALIVL